MPGVLGISEEPELARPAGPAAEVDRASPEEEAPEHDASAAVAMTIATAAAAPRAVTALLPMPCLSLRHGASADCDAWRTAEVPRSRAGRPAPSGPSSAERAVQRPARRPAPSEAPVTSGFKGLVPGGRGRADVQLRLQTPVNRGKAGAAASSCTSCGPPLPEHTSCRAGGRPLQPGRTRRKNCLVRGFDGFTRTSWGGPCSTIVPPSRKQTLVAASRAKAIS